MKLNELYLPTEETCKDVPTSELEDVYLKKIKEQYQQIVSDIKNEINLNRPIWLRDNGWEVKRVHDDFVTIGKIYEDKETEAHTIWFGYDIRSFGGSEFDVEIGSVSSRGNFSLLSVHSAQEGRIKDYYNALQYIINDSDFIDFIKVFLEEQTHVIDANRSAQWAVERVIRERNTNQKFKEMKTWFDNVWYMNVARASKDDYVRVHKDINNYPFDLKYRGNQVAPYDYNNTPTKIVYSEEEKDSIIKSSSPHNRSKITATFVKISTLKLNNEWIKH